MAIEKLKLIVKNNDKIINELIWDGDFEEWMLFGGEIIDFVGEYKNVIIEVSKIKV